MMCINLDEIVEHLGAAKTEKMPLTKQNIMVFLERAIRTTYIDCLEEIVDKLAPLAVAVSDEKDAACRDQGLVVLGVLSARVPTMMSKFIDPLIEQKKSKINAAKETVKISKYDKSEKKAAAAAAAAKKKAAAEEKKAATAKPAAAPKKTSVAKPADEPMADETGFGDDNVLKEVAPAAPRKPPPNIGKKPVSKKAEQPEEEQKPATSGPPPRLAAKAAASAAPSGPTKTIKAEDIQEEDLGAGISKEQAIERVSNYFDAGLLASFEEAKWQDKQNGFTGMKEKIE